MIYNINTVIVTAPKIPRTLDTVKAALLLGGVPCPSSSVVDCCPPPAVVVDDDAVIACDCIIVQNDVLSLTTVALLK